VGKIKVKNPIVEMDGDEMTRIIWKTIREKLILPYLDVELKYYDLGVEARDKNQRPDHDRRGQRNTQVRGGSEMRDHHAGRRAVEGVQPQQMWRAPTAPSAYPRRHDFREPIICKNVPRIVPPGISPSSSPVTVSGQYRATEIKFDGPGTIKLRSSPTAAGSGRARGLKAPGAGVSLAMFNLDESISASARLFQLRLCNASIGISSPPRTPSQSLRRPFQESVSRRFSRKRFKSKFDAAKLTYEHRLIDDMVARKPQVERRLTCGRARTTKATCSPTRSPKATAPRPHDLGVDVPTGRRSRTEAAHGTVTRHYRLHQQGKPT